MAQKIDDLLAYFYNQRKLFERRWYDNNSFDDGYHFRYVSRTTGKLVDIQENDNVLMPSRAIPKASRQIRGVANLLLLPEYRPAVYPEKISKSMFPQQDQQQEGAPGQAQQQEDPYTQALQAAKEVAKKKGHWLTKEWDKQELEEKLTLMVILAAKHGVSFIQCWPDSVEEKIKTEVFDAFDIYLAGSLNNIYDSPAIIKATPKLIDQIMANEQFDEDKKAQLIPDNKYAQSIIKDAYMRSRFGQGMESDMAKTLILKEALIKEYVSDKNREQIKQSLPEQVENYKEGDMIIRQTFVAGGVTLKDTYLDLPEYPLIDFRMEPGPIYQVPLIERFIPANKSLDIVMSRLERYFNTMITGTYLKRKGENMEITNIPGGQVLEYKDSKPEQMNMQNPQTAVFPFIQQLEKIIEEQGAPTAALGQLPTGVRSGKAIESVKQTEYANLRIPAQQLQRTVRLISERLLAYASKFIDPQTVYRMEKGEPTYFEIIGESGYEKRTQLDMETPEDTIVIRGDDHVDIQVEQGAGFTAEGQRDSMEKVIQFFTPLVQAQIIGPEAIKQIAQEVLDTYGFGATQEFMDAMDSNTPQMNEQQILQIKIAVGEVLKDAQIAGQPAEERAVMASKVGTLEALKESGMTEKIMGKEEDDEEKPPSESMSYKDAPPSIKRQMEAAAGYEPATEEEHNVQKAEAVSKLIPKEPKPTKKT